MSAPAAAEVTREIVFVVDGSASMGGGCSQVLTGYDADWEPVWELRCDEDTLFQAAKLGVSRALARLPVDGSVAVAVVQNSEGASADGVTFSGPETWLPRIVLDDESARAEAMAAVRGMTQIVADCDLPFLEGEPPCAAFNASAGWGLRFATDILAAGAPDAHKEVCYLGDVYVGFEHPPLGPYVLEELPARNFTLTMAYSYGAANDSLDRFSLVNVFSDKLGSILRATGEHEAEEQEWRLREWLAVHTRHGGRISYARDVHDFIDSIPGACLGEPVELVGVEVNQVVQDLTNSVPIFPGKPTVVRAFISHDDVAGMPADLWLHGYREDGTKLGRVSSEFSPVLARPDPFVLRENPAGGHLFIVPPSWLADDIVFELEQAGHDLICNEYALEASEKDCKVHIEVEAPAVLPPVRLLGVRHPEALLEREVATPHLERIEQLLPISYLDVAAEWSLDADPAWLTGSSVEERIRYAGTLWRSARGVRVSEYIDSGGSDAAPLFGFFTVPDTFGGPWAAAGGDGVAMIEVRSLGDHVETAVHEVAHAVGVPHNGLCGAESEYPIIDPWPWRRYSPILGGDVPLLGPIDQGPYYEAWGVDTAKVLADDYASGEAIVSPYRHSDVMGYCVRQWVSPFHYEYMHDIAIPRLSTIEPGSIAYEPHLFVRGIVNADDSVTLSPVYVRDYPRGAAIDQGEGYLLRTTNLFGNQVAEVPFGVVVAEGLTELDGTRDFVAVIPKGEGVYGLRVLRADGTELASGSVSSTPVGTIVHPVVGSVLSGDTATIQWSAHDSYGNAVRTLVEYSDDAGLSWRTLGIDVEGELLDVDLRSLPGSEDAFVRLTFSNGFGSLVRTAGPFSVPTKAPEVRITSPASGASFDWSKRVLMLAADAFDAEDGRLEGSALAWSSSLDGPLGEGRRLGVLASALSVGRHTITLTATDSGGATRMATTELDVRSLEAQLAAGGPDAAVRVLASGDFRPGSDNRYTVLVENVGGEATVGSVSLSVTLPDGVDSASASGDGWTCGAALDEVGCEHASPLEPGQRAAELILDAEVDPGLSHPGAVVAVVEARVEAGGDATPFNDVARARHSIRTQDFVDVALLSDRTGAWLEGHTVLFDLYVTNTGEAPVGAGVSVTQDFPAGVLVLDAGGEGWLCEITGQTVHCDWVGGELLPDQTAPPVEIEVLLEDGSTGAVETSPRVSAPLDAFPDNDVDRERGEVHAVVGAGPDLRVHVKGENLAWAGGQLALRHEVINDGVLPPTGPITLVHTLPPELEYAYAAGVGWSCAHEDGTVTCAFAGAPLGTKERAPLLWIYVEADLAAGSSTVVTTALVSAADDVAPGNDSFALTLGIVGRPSSDFVILLEPVTPLPLIEGEIATFEVRLRNIGTNDTYLTTERIDLAAFGGLVAWESASGTGWSCARRSSVGTFRCTSTSGPTVAGGELPLLTVSARVGRTAPLLRISLITQSGGTGTNHDNDGPPTQLPVTALDDVPEIYFSHNSFTDGQIARLSLPGEPVQFLTDEGAPRVTRMTTTPDGRTVVFEGRVGSSDTWLYAVDADGSGLRALTSGPRDFGPDVSPDGQRVVFERFDGARSQLYTVDLTSFAVELLYGPDDTEPFSARYLPDGRLVFFAWRDVGGDMLLRFDPVTGEEVVYPHDIEVPDTLDVSADGQWIVLRGRLAGQAAGLWLLPADPSSSVPPRLLAESTSAATYADPTFSADGAWVLARVSMSGNTVVLIGASDGRLVPVGSGYAPALGAGAARPLAQPDEAETLFGQPVEIDLLANDSEAGGTPLRLYSTTLPRSGELECDALGRCTYTPRGRFLGFDSFEYLVHDGDASFTRGEAVVGVRAPPPQLEVRAPEDGLGVPVPPGVVEVQARARLPLSPDQVKVVFVVDVDQVLSSQPLDCDGDGVKGGPEDDVTGDGRANFLDCSLVSLRALHAQLSGRRDVQAAIVIASQDYPRGIPLRDDSEWLLDEPYQPNVRVLDVSPAAGTQAFTGIDDDLNLDGTADVVEAAFSIYHNGAGICSEPSGAGAFTATEPMQCRTATTLQFHADDELLAALADLLDEGAAPGERSVVYWLSVSGWIADESADAPLWRLVGRNTPVHAYSATAWGCTYSPSERRETSLSRLTWLTGGACQSVLQDPSAAVARLPALETFGVERVEVRRVGDDPLAASFDDSESFSGTVPGIVPGPNLVEARVVTVDGWQVSEQVTVFGQGGGYNAAPLALADVVTITPPTPATVDVLANDQDGDGDVLWVSEWSDGADGSVSCADDGTCTYTAGASFADEDAFAYEIDDGHGGRAIGTVRVLATAGNQPPSARVHAVELADDGSASVDVMLGAVDPEGTAVSFISAGPAARGDVSCDAAGVCAYTPGPTFTSSDAFEYVVRDADGVEARAAVYVTDGPGSTDLTLSVVAEGAPFLAGGSATFRLSVSHVSGGSAAPVQVEAALPPGFVFDTATGEGWTCASGGPFVTCDRLELVSSAAPLAELVLVTALAEAAPAGLRHLFAEVRTPRDVVRANDRAEVAFSVEGSDAVPDDDAGQPAGEDAGAPPGDAGAPLIDAGPPPMDAGDDDAGAPPHDAGAPLVDAGAHLDDAGSSPPVDANAPPGDAGAVDDAGALAKADAGAGGSAADAGGGGGATAPDGCACAATEGARGRAQPGVIALLLTLVVLRRRTGSGGLRPAP